MLRSTFYGFNIAFSGLMTAQKALDLTGNNISNVNTAGYTRQRLDLNSIASASYTDRYAPYNNVSIGRGVNVTQVAQLRDPFLDARFRREAANIGELDSQLSALSDIARIFDEVQSDALNKSLEDLRTQLQVYSTQTGEVTIDTTVWSAAETVVKMLNQYSRQISEVRDYQEFLLKDSALPEVNKMLENLAQLNKNIRECEIYGNPALELKDERNLLLDKLSAYMKIDVTYYPDKELEDAGIKGVDICRVAFIADNDPPLDLDVRTLVDGVNYTSLVYNKVAADPADPLDPDRMTVCITKETPQPNEITNRENKITDPATTTDLFFSSGAIKGALDMLNSRGAFDDPPNTLNGIGYYESVLDRIVRDFAGTMNDANKYIDPSYEPYITDAVTGDLIPNPDPPPLLDDHPLFEAGDGSGVITAANIQIATGWKNGSYNLTTTKKLSLPGDDFSGETDNLLYMISLLDKSFSFTTEGINDGANNTSATPLYTGTFEQMFKNIGLIAAQDVSLKEKALSANTTVIMGIEDQRNSLSSVSMDEEGVNLLMFQKSYAANARVMTTLDEALDILINRLGIVGR